MRVGVLGALVMFLGLAVLSSLATEPFWLDENSHVAYAIALAHGQIPNADEPAPLSMPGQRPTPIYTANHPPLYYLLVTGPLLLGIHTGHPLLGLHIARLESVLFSAGTVALTAALAGTLVGRGRGRPEIAVAGALMATFGVFVWTSSVVYNDALATLLSVAVLLGTLSVIRSGLRARACVLLIVATAAAVLTRASNAEVLAVSAAGLVAAGAIHSRDRRRGAVRGIRWAAAMGIACIATSGWFYALNQARYGHISGRGPLRFTPHSFTSVLFSPGTYAVLARRAYQDARRLDRILTWSNALTVGGLVVIWSVVGIGLVWWLRRPPELRRDRAGKAIVVVLIVHAAACLLYLAWWVHLGGRANFRYLFPVLPVIAVGMARAITGLPGGRHLAALVVTTQVGLSLVFLAKLPVAWTGSGFWGAFPAGLREAGVPAPAVVTSVLLLIVLFGWWLCLRELLVRDRVPQVRARRVDRTRVAAAAAGNSTIPYRLGQFPTRRTTAPSSRRRDQSVASNGGGGHADGALRRGAAPVAARSPGSQPR